MGWDVLVFKLKDRNASARTLSEHDVLPVGSQQELRDAINSIIPDVDWSNPEWGATRINGCWLEFDINSNDGLSLSIHVHGSGDPVTPIAALCKAHGWAAFDTATADFLDLDRPTERGWERFQELRSRMAARMREADKKRES